MHINSVLNAFSIMNVFLSREKSLTLKSISVRTRMPPSKVHRYLQSLISAGMVTQDIDSGRYAIGPMAVEYGLTALSKIDPVRNACRVADVLANKLKCGVGISVNSPSGPIVIAISEPPDVPMEGLLRVGSQVPLMTSPTGHVFLAYMARELAVSLIRSRTSEGKVGSVDLDEIIHKVRTAGYGRGTTAFNLDFSSIAAPIFGPSSNIAAVMTFIKQGTDLISEDESFIQTLLDETRNLSFARLDKEDGMYIPRNPLTA